MRFTSYVLLMSALTHVVGSREARPPDYIGAERCRLCHRSVYAAWSSTAHSRATEKVTADPMNPGCLECHATGPAALRGVQCEACHGPGGYYGSPEVMVDPEKAREAGLVDPTESVCRSCHGRGPLGHSSSFIMPGDDEKRRVIH